MSADEKMAELIRRSVAAGKYDLSPMGYVPRDGYDYPTTLRPVCEGAPDRGLAPIVPLMSPSEES